MGLCIGKNLRDVWCYERFIRTKFKYLKGIAYFTNNHRFRQDGIIDNPNVPKQPGVSSYAPYNEQAAKFARILSFIPQKTTQIRSDILTDIERVN